jgi:hypothetical protein
MLVHDEEEEIQYTKAPWIVSNKEIDKVNKRLIDLKAPARIRTPFTTNGGVTCTTKLFLQQNMQEMYSRELTIALLASWRTCCASLIL